MIKIPNVRILLCAMLLTIPAMPGWMQARTLHFPGDRSMGNIFTRPTGAPHMMEWQWRAEARGGVEIAPGVEVRLDVAAEARNDLSPLAQLEPQAVAMFNLENTGANDTSLASLAGLSPTTLWLSKTRLTDEGLRHLSGMTDLVELNVWGTQVTDAGLVRLSRHRNLRRLSLRFCPVTTGGIAALGGLDKLQYLDLQGTHVASGLAKALGPMASLTGLNLTQTRLGDVELEKICRMRPWEHLGLRGMPPDTIRPVILSALGLLQNLRSLDLSQNDGLTDEGLALLSGCIRLEHLELAGCPLTDRSMAALERLHSLRYVNLYDTGISNRGFEQLRTELPHCRILR